MLKKFNCKSLLFIFILLINMVVLEPSFAVPNDSDTKLSDLYINCGELVPEFSSDIYDYDVYVTSEQENKDCHTFAEPLNGLSRIKIEGPVEFSNRDIEKKITVTDNEGEQSIYIINVHIVKNNELLLNGNLYVLEDPDFKLLPDGFQKNNVVTKRFGKITVAENPIEDIVIIQYVNDLDQNDKKWYMYNPITEEIYPSEVKNINGDKYVLISLGKKIFYGNNGKEKNYYTYDQSKEKMEFLDKRINVIGLIVIISAILITFILCILILIILRKGRYRNKLKVKYFRPYLSFDNEDMK